MRGGATVLVLVIGLAWGAQAGGHLPVDKTGSSASCALVRDALTGLDTRWPHRERAFSAVGAAPIPDSALTPGLLVDRVPPDRERSGDEGGPNRIAIGDDVYVGRGESWTHYVGSGMPGPRWSETAQAASHCDADRTPGALTVRFRVRIATDLVAAGVVRLREDGRPASFDLETPLPGGLSFRDTRRFEYDDALRIDAPPTSSRGGDARPIECSEARESDVRGEYANPYAGFAVTIPSPLFGCELDLGPIHDGVVIPLRAPGQRDDHGAIQVNAVTGLVSSLDQAVARQRAIFDAYAADSGAGAWEVSEARAGGLAGTRVRFWARDLGGQGPQQLDVVVVPRGAQTELGPIFYQIHARVPLVMAAAQAPILASVIRSFRTVDLQPLPAR